MMYRIPESWNVKREPRTPKNIRNDLVTHGVSFDGKFDWDTLFADAINIGNGTVLLIGPPLYELKDRVSFTDGKNILPHKFIDLDRVQYTLVQTDCKVLYVDELEIAVNDRCDDFAGQGYVMCMQKNEPFHWIEDWIRFNYIEHGVRGFCDQSKGFVQRTKHSLIMIFH